LFLGYGRTVAVLWTSDGVNVNLEMVCIGAAWWYERVIEGFGMMILLSLGSGGGGSES